MTVAERTREAVRSHPFLHTALRADVLNYTAAARFLEVGETEVVAAALRRYADDLPGYERRNGSQSDHGVRIDMQSGVGPTQDRADALVVVGDTAFAPDAGPLTAVLAVGAVGPDALADVLAYLRVEGVSPEAAGAASGGDGAAGHLAVVVGRREGPNVLRVVEDAL